MERIEFFDSETNETDSFFVLAETTLNQQVYLLVTEEEEGDSEALILKQITFDDESEEIAYEILEDEEEMEAISKIFMEILDDDTMIE